MQLKIRFWLPLLLLSFLLLAACKKEEKKVISVEKIVLDESITLRDIVFIDETLAFACGGMPGEKGCIWRSNDGGSDWIKVMEDNGHCIYDVEFLDAYHGFAGGDDLMLLRTNDGGNSWENIFANVSFDNWQEFIRPIRKIKFLNVYTIIAIGGDTYYKGLICRSYNWGQNWIFKNFDNQLNDIVMPDSRHAWISGYGIMLHSADSCMTLETADFREDNFTAIDFTGLQNGLACGYNGGIYLTSDGGASWAEKLSSNGTFGKRYHLNDICYADALNAFAVGNNGLILYTADGGNKWTRVKTDFETDLYKVSVKSAQEIFVCGTQGSLYNIRF